MRKEEKDDEKVRGGAGSVRGERRCWNARHVGPGLRRAAGFIREWREVEMCAVGRQLADSDVHEYVEHRGFSTRQEDSRRRARGR